MATSGTNQNQLDPNSLASIIVDELSLDARETSKIDTAIEMILESTSCTSAATQNEADADVKSTTPTDLQNVRGLYEVSYVKTIKEGENPVGGKWTRRNSLAQTLFRSRRSFQHILGINETGRGRPVVTTDSGKALKVLGEAVNVISLEALSGWIRATIILRGDVVGLDASERQQFKQGLSKNAIRALFDPPRIVLGKRGKFFNVSLGPRTSVVLDAPFVDQQIRLGLGGRSGTRFVFRRCSPKDEEANEFRELLYRKPIGKFPIMAVCGCISCAAAIQKTMFSKAIAGLSLLVGILFGTFGGGIEQNDRSIGDSKQVYGQ